MDLRKKKKKNGKVLATQMGRGKEEEIASFDRMSAFSKKGEKMTKRRRENEEKCKGNEMRKRKEKQKGRKKKGKEGKGENVS